MRPRVSVKRRREIDELNLLIIRAAAFRNKKNGANESIPSHINNPE